MPAIVYETAVGRVKRILQREQLAIYIYEIVRAQNLLQRRMGLNFGVPNAHWRVLYAAINGLVKQGVLVAYRDPIEGCLAVVAKSRWEKDVAADPEMEDLRVLDLPEIEEEIVMSVTQPSGNNEKGCGQ